MDKTVVVAVEDRVKHPLYGKVLRRTNKLKAHDEQNTAGVGDRVLLMETRPLSATKRWRVVRGPREGQVAPKFTSSQQFAPVVRAAGRLRLDPSGRSAPETPSRSARKDPRGDDDDDR